MPSLTLGYARISTTQQDSALQVDALTAAGCDRVIVETASGARVDRPKLARLVDEQLRAGDTLLIWRLDRLGRSLSELIKIAGDLSARAIGLRSLHEHIDTTTASGNLIFQVFGALAEFERALLLERTTAGLQAARARGRAGGRPPVMTPAKLAAAQAMYDSRAHPIQAIAESIGVSRATLYRSLTLRPTPVTAAA